MSYRISAEVYNKKGEKLGYYQLFGNNEYSEELYQYLSSKNLIDMSELEDDEYFFEDIIIEDLEEFNNEVIKKYIINRMKNSVTKNKYQEDVFKISIPVEGSILKKGNYNYLDFFIKTHILFISYNFYIFLLKGDFLISPCSLRLKDNLVLKISGY